MPETFFRERARENASPIAAMQATPKPVEKNKSALVFHEP